MLDDRVNWNVPSARKPYNDRPGYVASRRVGTGHIVIYDRENGAVQEADQRWVVVDHRTGEQTARTSLPLAREAMKVPDFSSAYTAADNWYEAKKAAKEKAAAKVRKTRASAAEQEAAERLYWARQCASGRGNVDIFVKRYRCTPQDVLREAGEAVG